MKRPRTARVAVELCKPSTARTWRLLETGILGLATPIHIVEADGTIRQRFYDPFKKRMVCEHGWGYAHVARWASGSAKSQNLLKKPKWATCDCKSCLGLEKVDELVDVNAEPPSLMSAIEDAAPAVELRKGLFGHPVPGSFDRSGCPLYKVRGDAVGLLRCRHGQTTNQLQAEMVRRRGYALSLVRTLVRLRSATPQARRAAVCTLSVLSSAAEAGRVRRGKIKSCRCAPVWPKAMLRHM